MLWCWLLQWVTFVFRILRSQFSWQDPVSHCVCLVLLKYSEKMVKLVTIGALKCVMCRFQKKKKMSESSLDRNFVLEREISKLDTKFPQLFSKMTPVIFLFFLHLAPSVILFVAEFFFFFRGSMSNFSNLHNTNCKIRIFKKFSSSFGAFEQLQRTNNVRQAATLKRVQTLLLGKARIWDAFCARKEQSGESRNEKQKI